MKRLILASFLAVATLAGAPAPKAQGSAHASVAVVTLPGEPAAKLDVDGALVTVTHYCR